MTLATTCQSFWLRAGLGAPTPGVWIGSADDTTLEVVEFAREALRMVVEAHEWQALMRTHTAALVGTPEQTVALPPDYGRLMPGSVWLTATTWPARGPVSDAEYEALRQPPVAQAEPVFRISGNALNLLAGSLGGNLTLRYITAQPVTINGGGARETWGADSDAALVSERLITLAMIALWRDARGLDADNAASLYRAALALAKAQDRPLGVMSMSSRVGSGRAPVGLSNGTTVTRL